MKKAKTKKIVRKNYRKLFVELEQEALKSARTINALREELTAITLERDHFMTQVNDLAQMSINFEVRIAAFRDAVTSLPGYNRIMPMGAVERYKTFPS